MSSLKYQHIDLQAISDIADGDPEFIGEIIGNYLTTVSESLVKLGEAISGGEAERVIFFAHKLKGSFAFVGAERLQQIVLDIEAAPEDVEAMKLGFSELQIVAGKVEAELKCALAELRG